MISLAHVASSVNWIWEIMRNFKMEVKVIIYKLRPNISLKLIIIKQILLNSWFFAHIGKK